jgi:hypothetical protein
MDIGFRRRRPRRSSFADPPNYTVGALYIVVVSITLVFAWVALDGVFSAPQPQSPTSRSADPRGDFATLVPAPARFVDPVPRFDEAIQLVDVDLPEAAGSSGPPPVAPIDDPYPAGAIESGPPDVVEMPAPAAPPRREKLRLQLAAVKSAAAGERLWNDLQRRQRDLLGDLRPAIARADLPEFGIVYRVRTAPVFADDAKRVCEALRRRQVACQLVKG